MIIDVELKLDQAQMQVENSMAVAIRMMMEDIHTLANPVTPLKNNALRTSVTKQMFGPLTGVIEWHVPYAAYQERGMRADGSHVVKNYTTPGTHAHFAEESVRKVIDQLPKYINIGGLV